MCSTVNHAANFHYVTLSYANYFFVYFLPKCNTHTYTQKCKYGKYLHLQLELQLVFMQLRQCGIAIRHQTHTHTQAWLLSLSQRKVGSESVLELDHCSSVSCTRLGSTHSLWTGHFVSVTPETNITPFTAVNRHTLKYHTQLDPNANAYRNITALNQAKRTS